MQVSVSGVVASRVRLWPSVFIGTVSTSAHGTASTSPEQLKKVGRGVLLVSISAELTNVGCNSTVALLQRS